MRSTGWDYWGGFGVVKVSASCPKAGPCSALHRPLSAESSSSQSSWEASQRTSQRKRGGDARDREKPRRHLNAVGSRPAHWHHNQNISESEYHDDNRNHENEIAATTVNSGNDNGTTGRDPSRSRNLGEVGYIPRFGRGAP